MSSSTSLQKPGGFEHSGLSDDSRGALKISRRSIIAGGLLLFAPAILFCALTAASEGSDGTAFVASETAAAQCRSKLKNLDAFAGTRKSGQTQTTRLSENEINSYLAIDLKPKYHASLKNLVVSLSDKRIQAIATIDFDHLGSSSTKVLPRLLGWMFSGVHMLTADGQILSKNGRANFVLERARFDDRTLPNVLVEEIISAVGRKQRPPFDPMQPSRMPYEINRVEVHPGYIIVFQ